MTQTAPANRQTGRVATAGTRQRAPRRRPCAGVTGAPVSWCSVAEARYLRLIGLNPAAARHWRHNRGRLEARPGRCGPVRDASGASSEALDDRGVGLAAALAHRLQAVPAADALELMQQLGHQD